MKTKVVQHVPRINIKHLTYHPCAQLIKMIKIRCFLFLNLPMIREWAVLLNLDPDWFKNTAQSRITGTLRNQKCIT